MEIFKAVEITKDFRKKYCGSCVLTTASHVDCDVMYFHECSIVDDQLNKLGSPCSHCAFITIDERKVECLVHNCIHMKNFE